MNDRSAEKYYVLQAVLDNDEQQITVQSVREDTQYGTEAYAWRLSFLHEGNTISAESYAFSEAVVALWDAAEALGLLNDQFIID